MPRYSRNTRNLRQGYSRNTRNLRQGYSRNTEAVEKLPAAAEKRPFSVPWYQCTPPSQAEGQGSRGGVRSPGILGGGGRSPPGRPGERNGLRYVTLTHGFEYILHVGCPYIDHRGMTYYVTTSKVACCRCWSVPPKSRYVASLLQTAELPLRVPC